jgi:hypothetical protein
MACPPVQDDHPIPSLSYSDSCTRNFWFPYLTVPPLMATITSPGHPPVAPRSHALSDHVRQLSLNVISKPSSPTQEQIPLSRILTRPDKLHPTLSCWIKNINKQSSLILHLQELASSAPADHRSQLLRQVLALRTAFKKQQEHCMEFLTLSEECANRYLLDISAEIQRQRSFLDKLEGRLEAANKLRREAVDLKMLYESGTVATMKDLRATGRAASCPSPDIKLLRFSFSGLSRPLPEDHALFTEVDLMLAEIRRCYAELDKFWTEEIFRAIEALKTHRIDPPISNAGRTFIQTLNKLLSPGRYRIVSYFLCCALPTNQNNLFRMSYQVAMLKPYAATAHSCLRLAHFSLPLSHPFKLLYAQESDIGAIANSLSSAVGCSHQCWIASPRATQ